MDSYNKKLATKGAAGEKALNKWLKKQKLPYVPIGQSQDSFSSLFPGAVKRPDFFLLLQSLGMIAIDAKNYKYSGGVFTLNLELELRKMIAFERLFRIPVWFAYMGEDSNEWYWISGLQAIEVGEVRENSKTKESFIAIKKSQCAKISSANDLGLLFSQTLPSSNKIAKTMG